MLFNKRILKSTWIVGITNGFLVKALGAEENVMGGHPGAANIRGSSNVLRGGLDASDIAVSDAHDGRHGCQANVDGFCSGRKICCRGMNCESNNCKANTTPSSSTTSSPTMNPTSSPSDSPTPIPTSNPTASPSDSPTLSPTPNPTASPSDSPTLSPTPNPTANPTASPSDSPTSSPTLNPTVNPTASPSDSPTSSPTPNPTVNPTASPSDSPTSSPTFGTTSSPTSLFCAITQEYSDGTSGDWELTSLLGGTDPSQVTTLENLDQFVIPADEVVNVVGTLVVYAKAIIINGTLDGSGGGYAGAPASYTGPNDYAPDGEQPACDLDENGECKTDSTIDGNGKGGFFTFMPPYHNGGGGAGHGGAGGEGGAMDFGAGGSEGGSAYDTDFFDTLLPGSGGGGGAGEGQNDLGGSGGAGGGAIFLYAHDILINGGIKVNGINGGSLTDDIYNSSGGGGGGSGGSLKISACNLSFDVQNSEVQANGGNGGSINDYAYGGGGGGGGIVKIDAANHNIDDVVISNSGGARGESVRYPDTNSGYAGNAGPAALINGVSFT